MTRLGGFLDLVIGNSLQNAILRAMKSRVGAVAHLLFVDLLGSIAWFPIWWYTKGLAAVSAKALAALRYRAQAYSFAIWIRNFFVPMYGQHDLTGRLVS